MEKITEFFRKKVLEVAVTAVASIQILQMTLLPSWLDFVTNLVILSLVVLVGKLSRSK